MSYQISIRRNRLNHNNLSNFFSPDTLKNISIFACQAPNGETRANQGDSSGGLPVAIRYNRER